MPLDFNLFPDDEDDDEVVPGGYVPTTFTVSEMTTLSGLFMKFQNLFPSLPPDHVFYVIIQWSFATISRHPNNLLPGIIRTRREIRYELKAQYPEAFEAFKKDGKWPMPEKLDEEDKFDTIFPEIRTSDHTAYMEKLKNWRQNPSDPTYQHKKNEIALWAQEHVDFGQFLFKDDPSMAFTLNWLKKIKENDIDIDKVDWTNHTVSGQNFDISKFRWLTVDISGHIEYIHKLNVEFRKNEAIREKKAKAAEQKAIMFEKKLRELEKLNESLNSTPAIKVAGARRRIHAPRKIQSPKASTAKRKAKNSVDADEEFGDGTSPQTLNSSFSRSSLRKATGKRTLYGVDGLEAFPNIENNDDVVAQPVRGPALSAFEQMKAGAVERQIKPNGLMALFELSDSDEGEEKSVNENASKKLRLTKKQKEVSPAAVQPPISFNETINVSSSEVTSISQSETTSTTPASMDQAMGTTLMLVQARKRTADMTAAEVRAMGYDAYLALKEAEEAEEKRQEEARRLRDEEKNQEARAAIAQLANHKIVPSNKNSRFKAPRNYQVSDNQKVRNAIGRTAGPIPGTAQELRKKNLDPLAVTAAKKRTSSGTGSKRKKNTQLQSMKPQKNQKTSVTVTAPVRRIRVQESVLVEDGWFNSDAHKQATAARAQAGAAPGVRQALQEIVPVTSNKRKADTQIQSGKAQKNQKTSVATAPVRKIRVKETVFETSWFGDEAYRQTPIASQAINSSTTPVAQQTEVLTKETAAAEVSIEFDINNSELTAPVPMPFEYIEPTIKGVQGADTSMDTTMSSADVSMMDVKMEIHKELINNNVPVPMAMDRDEVETSDRTHTDPFYRTNHYHF